MFVLADPTPCYDESGVLVRCCMRVGPLSPLGSHYARLHPANVNTGPRFILLHRTSDDKEVLSYISRLCLWSIWF